MSESSKAFHPSSTGDENTQNKSEQNKSEQNKSEQNKSEQQESEQQESLSKILDRIKQPLLNEGATPLLQKIGRTFDKYWSQSLSKKFVAKMVLAGALLGRKKLDKENLTLGRCQWAWKNAPDCSS
jgi:uncharacterized FlaG/YvyC family protein